MRPYRKPFDVGSAFPFDCVYRDRKNYKTELPDHLHEWHELVYIHEGKGTFFVDQTLYEMKRGDLFLIPGSTIHQSFPDRADPVTTTAVFFSSALVQAPSFGESFSFLRCLEHAKKYKSFKYEPAGENRRQVELLLDEIAREREERQPGYRQAVLLLLQRLLLLLGRSIVPPSEQQLATAAVIGPPWMQDILRHIDRHPELPLSLSALAERAAVTPAHFSRVFKRLTGMNVTDYVTTKRIIRAKELLRGAPAAEEGQPDLSASPAAPPTVQQIAEQCGFESLPHFHRMFKKLAGMTPAAYKKKEATAKPGREPD
ncbi:helix-turn-helix domain-containing protein [Paenibacillus thailandensis]|uniref:Helix-turn-helix domain-containing protein n=1 Tax=Paenibacillus thailandensis TaxID=393250 RepID=A0ABW5QV89_9BACL